MKIKLLKIIFLLLCLINSLFTMRHKHFHRVFTPKYDKQAESRINEKKVRNSLFSETKKEYRNGEVSIDVNEISNNILQFVFKEVGKDRFELPETEPFPHHKKNQKVIGGNTVYSFEVEKEPFSITVKRNDTGEIIFSTKNFNIVFDENYSEITTSLPSNNLFGLGERTTSFKLKPGTYTIYNRDAYGDYEDGNGGKNRYGSHPMYLMREESGYYHIVYLRNSFAMDVIYTQHEGDPVTYSLTYKAVGGVLDFSIFFGDTNPETTTKMYHEFAGGHTLPPFWSMGFHQCRWGYENLGMIYDVLVKYKEHKIPMDTIWMDIDYMQEYVPFTVDEKRYNLSDFKKYLEIFKKKFVMIAEPAMSIKWPDYEYLVKGKQLDLFIKNGKNENLINRVWPGDCYFIDYFNPKTENYWFEALDKLHEKIDFSGVWLDMNELATFEPGQVDEYDRRISCEDETKYSYLPGHQALERNTICPNAKHYGGFTHSQMHNYLPVMQQMLTFKFLEKKLPDQFPFILSRANTVGTGKWSFHWTGDNIGNFKFYKASVTETMNSNIFGIPMVGADICGFGDNTPATLCAKFYQMGSLFPFSRSHSAKDAIRKEPWMMNETLLTTTRKSLQFRYQILKYYYSLFILNGGVGTIFKPLFYNFYQNDIEVLKDTVLEGQFMIGEDLLVIPNFNDDDITTKVNGYFPKGAWFDLRDNSRISNTQGTYVDIEAPLNEMPPVFLRGGKTIYMNNVENVENTYDLNDIFELAIAFDNSETKEIYISHGKIPALKNYHSKQKVNNCLKKNCFIDISSSFYAAQKVLSIEFSESNFYDEDYDSIGIRKFRIYGIDLSSGNIKKTNFNVLYENDFLSNKNFEISQVSNNYFEVEMKQDLKILKEKIAIYFQLQ